MGDLKEFVREALKAAGVSYRAASNRLGIPEDAISKFMNGRRDLSADELRGIEEMTGRKWGSKNTETVNDALTTDTRPRQMARIRVVGETAGGVWKDMSYVDFPEYDLSYPVDERWPREAVNALRVTGESINRQARDGDHVVCLAIWAMPRDLRDGDWVVVHRHKADLIETTVKQLKGEPGAFQLWPDSTDPRFQEPVPYEGIDPTGDDEIRVVAVVLDFIRPATRI